MSYTLSLHIVYNSYELCAMRYYSLLVSLIRCVTMSCILLDMQL